MLNPAKPIDLADAVGVEGDKHWYVAIVRHGDERRCGVQLTSYGYENFIPVQRVARRYPDGRKKKVEKLVLPSRVFVRATEFVRLKYIVNFPVVLRFMVDRARRKSSDSASPVAIVPDAELQLFRRMLNQGSHPVRFVDHDHLFAAGDKVRVVSGSLAGLEGFVGETEGSKGRLYVQMDFLGVAVVEINKELLEQIY